MTHWPVFQHRYCDKCQAIKPDRSHHCSVCGSCILKMDHHCPWVNNCVAFNNYKFFMLFLGYALVYTVYLALCNLEYFIKFWTDGLRNTGVSEGSGKFHILFLFFVSLFISILFYFLYICSSFSFFFFFVNIPQFSNIFAIPH